MAIKDQRISTQMLVKDYEALVSVLVSELADADNEVARQFHDEVIRLRKESERIGLR